MKNITVEDLAGNALSMACAHIQDELGIKTGDIAGIYFASEEGEEVLHIFKKYIEREIFYKGLPND